MVFLHSHGVGTTRAVRIFKTYGGDAIQAQMASCLGPGSTIQTRPCRGSGGRIGLAGPHQPLALAESPPSTTSGADPSGSALR